eukprot:15428-Heterococcus_DN1.PRE.1
MPLPFLPFTDEQMFPIVQAVIPAWALLVFAPRWSKTRTVVALTILFYSILYLLLMVNAYTSGTVGASDMNTLPGVRRLLGHKMVTFAAWVHYIAFAIPVETEALASAYLLAGLAMVHDNTTSGSTTVPKLVMAPVLATTLMAGPAGLASYLLAKKLVEVKNSRRAKRKPRKAA